MDYKNLKVVFHYKDDNDLPRTLEITYNSDWTDVVDVLLKKGIYFTLTFEF